MCSHRIELPKRAMDRQAPRRVSLLRDVRVASRTGCKRGFVVPVASRAATAPRPALRGCRSNAPPFIICSGRRRLRAARAVHVARWRCAPLPVDEDRTPWVSPQEIVHHSHGCHDTRRRCTEAESCEPVTTNKAYLMNNHITAVMKQCTKFAQTEQLPIPPTQPCDLRTRTSWRKQLPNILADSWTEGRRPQGRIFFSDASSGKCPAQVVLQRNQGGMTLVTTRQSTNLTCVTRSQPISLAASR